MSQTEINSANYVLRGATAILPDGGLDQSSVLIEGGRISRVLAAGETADVANASSVALGGLTLYPGFIDIHIHGAAGVDTNKADAGDLQKAARYLAREGVTAWLPTLVPAPDEDYRQAARAVQKLMREQADEQSPPAARALGLHYEGPFVNTAQCGALRTAYFKTFKNPEDADALALVEHESAVHMITLAPEVEGGIELVRELRRRGFVISIGHTRAEVETLDAAHAAGARHMTHFFNAMTPLHHRRPGPVGWGLVRDEVTCDVIADGVHIDPLMIQLALRCKTAERLVLVSDAVAPAGLGDGEFQVWGETISVREQQTSNERGSIAGSVISLCDAVRMMLGLGVPAHDVARMASLNPARLLGVDNLCGSIEEGKRADLVAFDTEGNVRLTLIGGRVAFDARGQTSAS